MSFQSAKHAHGSSNREAKGFLFLILLLVIPFLIQYSYRAIFYEPKEINLSGIEYLTDSCETKTSFNEKQYKSDQGYNKQNYVYNKPVAGKPGVVKIVDINNADTTLLKTLPGIGSVYAARIVKYRKLLGGFVSVNQIKEVYGIKIETFDQIKSQITLTKGSVIKIPADSLWNKPYAFYHPYLSKEVKAQIQAENKKAAYSNLKLQEIIAQSNSLFTEYIVWR